MEKTPKRVYTRFIESNDWQQSDSAVLKYLMQLTEYDWTEQSDYRELCLSSAIGIEVHR